MKLNFEALNVRRIIIRYLVFFGGLFLVANGAVCTINASLGVSPWDVFHIGMANQTGLTIGRIHQLTGFTVLAVSYFFKVRIHIGTLLNMIFLGLFIDMVITLDYLPYPDQIWTSILLYLAGVILFGLGVAFYISPNLGAGPRDSLMLALTRITRLKTGVIRTIMEIAVAVIGYLLGGPLGIGTVLFALTLGFFMETGFSLVKWIKKSALFRTVWCNSLPRSGSTG
jgi:hypothetical protein